MATSEKKLKILLYGSISESQYRTQNLIRILINSGHLVTLVNPNFYAKPAAKKASFTNKILMSVHLLEVMIKILFADVVYILPFNTHLIEHAMRATRIFHKSLVTESFISLYDAFVKDRKVYGEGSREAALAKHRDRLALTQSNYVIAPSEHEVHYWETMLGIQVNRHKVFIAPIFANSTLTTKNAQPQNEVLRICWWGTFIPLHGLEHILAAMQLLKERGVQFTCQLFGVDNPFYQTYAEQIQARGLDSHLTLRKDLKFSDRSLPRYLRENCDLALGIFGNTDRARNTVPTKVVDALSLGLPLLTMRSSALSEFFDPEVDLWTCEPNPAAIATAIQAIQAGTLYPVDWQQTHQKVLATFSPDNYEMVIDQVLQTIAQPPPVPMAPALSSKLYSLKV